MEAVAPPRDSRRRATILRCCSSARGDQGSERSVARTSELDQLQLVNGKAVFGRPLHIDVRVEHRERHAEAQRLLYDVLAGQIVTGLLQRPLQSLRGVTR